MEYKLKKIKDILRHKIDNNKIKDYIMPLFFIYLRNEEDLINLHTFKDFKDYLNNIENDIKLNIFEDFIENEYINTETLKQLKESIISIDRNDLNIQDVFELIISKNEVENEAFLTPSFVSSIMSKINTKNKDIKTIYDPTAGLSSLLIAAKHSHKESKIKGQDINTTLIKLSIFKLLLNNINDFEFKVGDLLKEDLFKNEQFDLVVSNPPYSLKFPPEYINEDRYHNLNIPKGNADYAFVIHSLNKINENGVLNILMPLGTLFRDDSKHIREYLIKNGYLKSVILMPKNIFNNTTIQTVLYSFTKEKNENVLFFDTVFHTEKIGKYNTINNVDTMLDKINNRETKDGESNLVSIKTIEDNNFNLNITRYVYIEEVEEKIDYLELIKEEAKIKEQIKEIEKELKPTFDSLIKLLESDNES